MSLPLDEKLACVLTPDELKQLKARNQTYAEAYEKDRKMLSARILHREFHMIQLIKGLLKDPEAAMEPRSKLFIAGKEIGPISYRGISERLVESWEENDKRIQEWIDAQAKEVIESSS